MSVAGTGGGNSESYFTKRSATRNEIRVASYAARDRGKPSVPTGRLARTADCSLQFAQCPARPSAAGLPAALTASRRGPHFGPEPLQVGSAFGRLGGGSENRAGIRPSSALATARDTSVIGTHILRDLKLRATGTPRRFQRPIPRRRGPDRRSVCRTCDRACVSRRVSSWTSVA